MHSSSLSLLGAAILPAYLLLTLVIGWLARRRSSTAGDYLNASHSLPLWIVSASFLSANCGALEIVGLSAMAAEYGPAAFHFYWIGAIPGMIFVALWMIPVYRGSGVRSVPEYLEARYSSDLRLVNAWVTAVMTLMLAGISLYAMAQVLHVVLGLGFRAGVLLSASVVLLYVLLGGVRATIYNEVLQLLVMLAGLVPLLLCTLRSGAIHLLPTARDGHLWTGLPLASRNAPMDLTGVVLGLGFVLSFSYWGTDFVLIQRALAARTAAEARQVPLWAGFGKLAFSLIVVLPGLAAPRLIPALGTTMRFDQALPAVMRLYYGPVLLGLGLTALAASLMSGLAANISAFAAVWTQDIYRTRLRPGLPERHYLRMGYAALCAATCISIAGSSVSFLFGNLMEYIQLIFSVFAAPFWAIFLLGMAGRRITARGALAGFLSGTAAALLHQALLFLHRIHYGSPMSGTFHVAIYAFCTAFIVASIVSLSAPQPSSSAPVLAFHWNQAVRGRGTGTLLLAVLLLATCVLLNLLWR